MLNRSDASGTASRILPKYKAELERLDKIDRYLRDEHAGPYMPKSAGKEYKLLAERRIRIARPRPQLLQIADTRSLHDIGLSEDVYRDVHRPIGVRISFDAVKNPSLPQNYSSD